VLDVAACGLGRDVERVGDLGVGHPLADQPCDLELTRCQGSPRLVVRGMAARHSQDRLGALGQGRRLEPVGRGARLRADRDRLGEPRRADQALGEVDASPGRFPCSPVTIPTGHGRLERETCDPRRAIGHGDQPSPVVERGRRDIRDRAETIRAFGHPGRTIGRTARLLRGPDPGHHERDEEHPLADGGGPGQCLTTLLEGPRSIAGLERDLRESPQWRQHQLDLFASRAECQRGLEFGARRIELAAGHRHVPKGPPCHERAAAAALVDDRLAGSSLGLDQVGAGPRHHRPRRAHHVGAMRLLDRVGVAHAFFDPALRRGVVERARRDGRRLPEGGDSGPFPAFPRRLEGSCADTFESDLHVSRDRVRQTILPVGQKP
jgi:hypothetical protein